MKYIIVILCITLISCYHESEIKYESGFVVEKQYFPDTKQIVMGSGITTGGDMVITTHQIGEDEKYIVIIKCEHGVVFSINRSSLYGSVNKYDTISIKYREVLNGKNEIVDFDFIDAIKK